MIVNLVPSVLGTIVVGGGAHYFAGKELGLDGGGGSGGGLCM